MRIFLTLVRLLTLLAHGLALSFSAPQACGGNRTVLHATALFGPKLQIANVLNAHIFVPRPQAHGSYSHINSITRSSLQTHSPISLPQPPPRAVNPTHPLKPRSLIARLFVRRPDGLLRAHPSASASVSAETAPHPVTTISDRLASGTDPIKIPNAPNQLTNQQQSTRQSSAMNEHIQFSTMQDNTDSDSSKEDSSSSLFHPLYNACDQLSVPNEIRSMKGNVAVVTRGDCDFSRKVVNMQHAGAIGVIVVNFEESSRLRHMKLNESVETPVINIPAVMINYKAWASIAPCQSKTTVNFTVEGEASFDIDYGREALNWAMMRGVALWILCQCGVNVVRHKRRTSEFRARADAIAALPVQTYSRHPNNSETDSIQQEHTASDISPENHPDDNISSKSDQTAITDSYDENSEDYSPRSSIREDQLEHSPLVTLDEESISRPSSSTSQVTAHNQTEDVESSDSEDPVCAVCLERFLDGEQVRELPCSHLYHKKCIDPWFQSSSNCCPLCKREVPDLPPLTSQLQYGSMIV